MVLKTEDPGFTRFSKIDLELPTKKTKKSEKSKKNVKNEKSKKKVKNEKSKKQ